MTFNNSGTACVLAVTTAPSEEEGRRIVRVLVERRIIACGNVLPLATSIYRWKGAVEEAREAVVLMKTRMERVGALQDALPALHPYEVPELIVVPNSNPQAPARSTIQQARLSEIPGYVHTIPAIWFAR